MKNSVRVIFFIAWFFTHTDASANPDVLALPSERGEIIFHCNENSPNQLYIIAIGHRDILTRANGSDTVKGQVDVFQISEWLIQEEGLELLLPEGFFLNESADEKEAFKRTVGSVALDTTKTLEEKLGRNDAYINAEMLLMAIHDMKSRQVEDKDLYDAVIEKVSLLEKYKNTPFQSDFIKSMLDYLRERRTAAMLQNAPLVIDSEYKAGEIKDKKGTLTIGLEHIAGIIKYLKQNKIEIISPAFTPYDDYLSELNLLKNDFGVTIIIPKTLADNQELLKLTRLDNIQQE